MTERAPVTYRDAGVDIDAGEELVSRIGPAAKATRRPGADAELGGFGGLFDLKAAGFKDPVLVASTDGVGTKLKIAIETRLFGGRMRIWLSSRTKSNTASMVAFGCAQSKAISKPR